MRISVKVIPRASKNEVECIAEGEYRVRLTALAKDDKANRSLIKLLAEHFGVAPSLIRIVAGGNARQKIIEFR